MGDIIPNEIKKVIYIDCDVIILKDVFNLWNKKLNNNYILAVQDFGIPYADPSLGIANLGIVQYEELGIDPYTPYFNSGVMLVNLKRWRNKNIGRKAIRYVREYDTAIRCHDQEALNVVVGDNWKAVDPRWNVTYLVYDVNEWPDTPFKHYISNNINKFIDDVYIMHYAGTRKPWSYNGTHPAREWFFEEITQMRE